MNLFRPFTTIPLVVVLYCAGFFCLGFVFAAAVAS